MNTTSQSEQHERTEKRAQLVWTGIILSFFLIQAVIWTIAISITANDRSHSIVEGYDQKALNWDEEQALRQASAKLNWHAEFDADALSDVNARSDANARSNADARSDIRGNRTLTIKLFDANHEPLSDVAINVRAFHRSRASEPQMLSFNEDEDGVYSSTIQVRKSGRWQFDGQATRGGETFLVHEQINLEKAN